VLRGLPPPLLAGPSWPWLIRIRVLGPFECEVDGHSLGTYSCKAASKPLALLRRLAVLTGYEGVSPDLVANELWPGEGREGREKVLETTLARLRKLLGSADAVLLHEHRLRLNAGLVWIDAAMLAGELESLRAPEETEMQWRRIVGLYRGPLRADETGERIVPWRNRLRALLATALLTARETPGDRERWMLACAVDAALASHRPE
jgi:DNA-binding SARP family transcriptional activator